MSGPGGSVLKLELEESDILDDVAKLHACHELSEAIYSASPLSQPGGPDEKALKLILEEAARINALGSARGSREEPSPLLERFSCNVASSEPAPVKQEEPDHLPGRLPVNVDGSIIKPQRITPILEYPDFPDDFEEMVEQLCESESDSNIEVDTDQDSEDAEFDGPHFGLEETKRLVQQEKEEMAAYMEEKEARKENRKEGKKEVMVKKEEKKEVEVTKNKNIKTTGTKDTLKNDTTNDCVETGHRGPVRPQIEPKKEPEEEKELKRVAWQGKNPTITQDGRRLDNFSNLQERFKEEERGAILSVVPELYEVIRARTITFTSLKVTPNSNKKAPPIIKVANFPKERIEQALAENKVPMSRLTKRQFGKVDLLMPTKEQAMEWAKIRNVIHKDIMLQPSYMGRRNIVATIHDIPGWLDEERLAWHLSQWGDIEETYSPVSGRRVETGDMQIRMSLSYDQFISFPNTLEVRVPDSEETRKFTIVIPGKRPTCWHCKVTGHISKDCPEKKKNNSAPEPPKTTIKPQTPAPAPSTSYQDEDGFTLVATRKKGGTQTTHAKEMQDTKETTLMPPRDKEVKKEEVKKEEVEKEEVKKEEEEEDEMEEEEEEEEEEEDEKMQQGRPTIGKSAAGKRKISKISSASGAKSADGRKTLKLKGRRRRKSPPVPRNISDGSSDPKKKEEPSVKEPPQLFVFPQTDIMEKQAPTEELAIALTQEDVIENLFSAVPLGTTLTLTKDGKILSQPPPNQNKPPDPPRKKIKQDQETVSAPTPLSLKKYEEAANCTPADEPFYRGNKVCHLKESAVALWSPKQTMALIKLKELVTVDGKPTCNPMKFRNAPLVTTLIRKGNLAVWEMIKEAEGIICKRGLIMVQRDTDHIRKILKHCEGRVPVLVHPSLYRALKCNIPKDVGGIVESLNINKELAVGPLDDAVGVLTPAHFRPIVAERV